MKFGIITLIILAGLMQQNDAGPLRNTFFKRAAFYVANETACVVDNIVFSNGEPIPTDDPCETCRCRPPGFACVLHECVIKPGCRAVRRDGYCCPEYVCGCEHDGRMYSHGDEIKNSMNPCTVCHCQGSSIACTHVDCFYRMDCAPEYVAGECCPRYTNCPSINDESIPTENTAESSSEETISLPALISIITPSEETSSPDGTESNDGYPNVPVRETVVGPFILEDAEETEMKESVENSEETDMTENSENSPSSAEIDATDLDRDIVAEKPVNDIFLNSGTDLNGKESMEETKEKEHEIVVDERDPEVIVLSTEELEVAISETAPFVGSTEASEDSKEEIAVAIEKMNPAKDETIDPEAKRKSMKLPEEDEISTDIVPEENVEPITRDQSEEETSVAAILVKETLNDTKVLLFTDDLLTENSETSFKESEESTHAYEDIAGQTKEPMNENDGVTEQFMDEVITDEEKKPRVEENEETVTVVVLVKDDGEQSTENPDESKPGEQILEEEGESVEETKVIMQDERERETEKPEMETELPLEEADQSVEERQDKETELSVEEVDQPREEVEKPVKETEISLEEVDQPVEGAEKPVSETEISLKEVDQPVEGTEKSVSETVISVEEVELSVENGEQETEESNQSDERVNQPTNDDPVISNAPAESENRYKALDEAILSAFVPDDSTSVDESFDENRSLATEISKAIETEDTSDQADLVTSLPESTEFSKAEVTAMTRGDKIGTESERIQEVEENEGN